MTDKEKRFEEEIAELKEELGDFLKERKRVRTIVEKVSGVPVMRQKAFGFLLFILVLGCLIISLLTGGVARLAMIEVAIAIVSLKLIYMMNCHAQVNHFNLWILTSIEWRLNEIIKELRQKERR